MVLEAVDLEGEQQIRQGRPWLVESASTCRRSWFPARPGGSASASWSWARLGQRTRPQGEATHSQPQVVSEAASWPGGESCAAIGSGQARARRRRPVQPEPSSLSAPEDLQVGPVCDCADSRGQSASGPPGLPVLGRVVGRRHQEPDHHPRRAGGPAEREHVHEGVLDVAVLGDAAAGGLQDCLWGDARTGRLDRDAGSKGRHDPTIGRRSDTGTGEARAAEHRYPWAA